MEDNNRALMENALRKISRLNKEIADLKSSQHEPIAIVGIGCRYPGGANSAEAFWNNLREGVDAVSPLTNQRWDHPRYFDAEVPSRGKTYSPKAGLLDDVLRFDAEMFGITPREAECMDPQQRILLEVVWEALENAGMPVDKARGSNAGVFVGLMNQDHSDLLVRHLELDKIAAHMNTGNHESVHAGRLSYAFDFRGPCVTLNTACSSSLVAVHLACQSLRQSECDFAVAGGCNVILAPVTSIAQSQAMMHSKDGLCKAFDASADGYVRAEGCGILVLKRLSKALADNDHIHALIRGSAVNQDGLSQGITAPNGPAQVRVIRSALDNARVNPCDVGYVEAHGTGTKLGDPIELQALGTVYGRAPGRTQPLLVGSLKTNIGHAESAAGVASMIKVARALQEREIPPQLHLKNANPFVDLRDENIEICTQLKAWPQRPIAEGQQAAPLYAGVSSFGFSGTNAHVVMEAYTPGSPPANVPESGQYLLLVSAQQPAALKSYAGKLIELIEQADEQQLADICYSQNTGRRHFECRVGASGKNKAELIEALGRALGSLHEESIQPRTCFILGELDGATRAHYQTLAAGSPLFQDALTRFAEAAAPILARDIAALLWNDAQPLSPAEKAAVDNAMHYAFATFWRELGVQPALLLATAGSRFAAAAAAGTLSLGEAIQELAAQTAQSDDLYLYEDKSRQAQRYQHMSALGPRLQAATITTSLAFGEPAKAIAAQLASSGPAIRVLPALEHGIESWASLARIVATLYQAGCPILAEKWDKRPQRVKRPLPTYAFQGQRYWLERLAALRDETTETTAKPRSTHAESVAPSDLSLRQHVKQLIAQLAKLGDKPISENSQLIEDIGFDSLMLTELRTKLEKAYPSVGRIPMEILFGNKLSALLEFIEERAGTTSAIVDSAAEGSAQQGLEQAISWLNQWKPLAHAQPPVRMDKKNVHKALERNVLLGDIAKVGETGWYAAELFHDAEHPFFYEHAQDHIPGLYLIEAVRQFGIACAHLFQGVPHHLPFVLDDMHIQFDVFAEHAAPVYLVAEYTDLFFKDGNLQRTHSRCHVIQNGTVLGSIEGRGTIMQKDAYQTVRGLKSAV